MEKIKKLCEYFPEMQEGEVRIGSEDYRPSVSSIGSIFYLALADDCTELEVSREEFVMLMMYFHPSPDKWDGRMFGIKITVKEE